MATCSASTLVSEGQGFNDLGDFELRVVSVALLIKILLNYTPMADVTASALMASAKEFAGLPENILGIVQTNIYNFVNFGHHTNNLLSGADSMVIRGNIRCTTNNTGARVIVDSADFHIPLRQLGSTSTLTDD